MITTIKIRAKNINFKISENVINFFGKSLDKNYKIFEDEEKFVLDAIQYVAETTACKNSNQLEDMIIGKAAIYENDEYQKCQFIIKMIDHQKNWSDNA